MFGTKKIKQEKIVQQWTMLIEGGNSFGEKVLLDTVKNIEKVAAPDIHVSRQERKPVGGWIKASRQFLIAEHKLFDTYDMYISARDYGKQLFVAWYVLAEPIGFWRRFKSFFVGIWGREVLRSLPINIFNNFIANIFQIQT